MGVAKSVAMPHNKPLSASLVICESVLTEKTEVISAIRIMTSLRIAPDSNFVRFYALTVLTSYPQDTQSHVLRVLMIEKRGDEWEAIATAQDHSFFFGYNVDPSGPGAYFLTTEFVIDVSRLTHMGTCFVQALLDGERVAMAPITLRR
jgi:hypothetical protein